MMHTLEEIYGKDNVHYVEIDNAAASGVLTVKAAVAGHRIRLINGFIPTDGSCTLEWRSNTTPLSGAIPADTKGPVYNEAPLAGWLQTEVGEALNLNISAAVNVDGHCVLVTIPGP